MARSFIIIFAFLAQYGMVFAQEPEKPGDLSHIRPNGETETGFAPLRHEKGMTPPPDSRMMILNDTAGVSGMNAMARIIKSFRSEAKRYYQLDSFDKSLVYYHLAASYAHLSAYTQPILAACYNSIATIHHYRGEKTQAARYYYIALHFANKYPSHIEPGPRQIAVNLSSLLASLDHTDQALRYLDQAEEGAAESGDYKALGGIFSNKGNIYVRLVYQNPEDSMAFVQKALSYYFKALDIGRTHHLPGIRYSALANLAVYYLYREVNPRKSLPFFEEALSIRDSIPTVKLLSALSAYGEALSLMNRYREAEKNLHEALTLSSGLNMKESEYEIHKKLARHYKRKKDYPAAMDHIHEFLVIGEQREKAERVNEITRMEVQYQTAQKDRDLIHNQLLIARQKEELSQKNTLILLAVFSLLVLGLLIFIFYRNNRQKEIILSNRIHILQQEQEIGYLKAMMQGEEKERGRIARELHDGIGGMIASLKMRFSALQSRYRILEDAPEYLETLDVLNETSGEIRKTAHNLMPELLLRYGLDKALRIFCDNIRKGQNLHIDFQCLGINGQLNGNFELTIYRIIQELLQNIVKHAKASKAIIQIYQYEDTLNILVEDNGIGISSTQQSEGMGLESLRIRTKAMNGVFTLESNPDTGTTAYLQFDLKKINLLSV